MHIRVLEETYKTLKEQSQKTNIPIVHLVNNCVQEYFKVKTKKRGKVNLDLQVIWFKHYGAEYTLPVKDRYAIISIEKHLLKVMPDKPVTESFKLFLSNLPEWWKDKGISTLNSKFYDLIKQIRENKRDINSLSPEEQREIIFASIDAKGRNNP